MFCKQKLSKSRNCKKEKCYLNLLTDKEKLRRWIDIQLCCFWGNGWTNDYSDSDSNDYINHD